MNQRDEPAERNAKPHAAFVPLGRIPLWISRWTELSGLKLTCPTYVRNPRTCQRLLPPPAASPENKLLGSAGRTSKRSFHGPRSFNFVEPRGAATRRKGDEDRGCGKGRRRYGDVGMAMDGKGWMRRKWQRKKAGERGGNGSGRRRVTEEEMAEGEERTLYTFHGHGPTRSSPCSQTQQGLRPPLAKGKVIIHRAVLYLLRRRRGWAICAIRPTVWPPRSATRAMRARIISGFLKLRAAVCGRILRGVVTSLDAGSVGFSARILESIYIYIYRSEVWVY